MSGTKAGGIKAAQTIHEKYGKGFYSIIGRKGGKSGHTGGFAADPQLARLAGAKGGRRSKRRYHLSGTKLCRIIDQYSGVKHATVRVKMNDGLVVTISVEHLRILAKLCGKSASFEEAFEKTVVLG